MTNAAYSRPGTASATNAYKETVSYDINGNIQSMVRNGNSETGLQPFEMDRLFYNYEHGTNRLLQVYDSSASPLGFKDDVNGTPDTDDDYGYDNRGNMTSDQNKGITITYNHLDLPVEITFSGTNRKITYIYTATGEKVRKIVNDNSEGVTTDYLDGFQYRDGKMQLFPTSEGYVSNTRANGHNNYRYVYNYTDHLGNVRLSYGKNENDELKIMEENHYYPYGLKHTNYNTDQKEYGKSEQGEQVLLKAPPGGNDTVNEVYKYKYNGCEYQDELGLNLYDMDMRDYDPAIGRWLGIDPVTHADQSPYMAMNGNPVYCADPSGADGIPVGLPPEAINTWHYAGSGGMYNGAGNLSSGDHMFGSSGDSFWGNQTAFTGGNLAWNSYIRDNGQQTFSGKDASNVFSYFAMSNGYTKYTWTYFDEELKRTGVGIGTYRTSIYGNSKNALDIAGGIYGALEKGVRTNGRWLGTNGKYYSDAWGGNRYTGSRSGAYASASGYKWAGRAAVGASIVIGGIEVMNGYERDGGRFGYNAQFAAASNTGGLVGGYVGAEGGAAIGAAIGVWFGGVGAVPGAIIGGFVGGYLGNQAGAAVGEGSINYYYGQ